MNDLEKQLHYPLGDTLPEPGDTLAVAPGVKWIRMALPFALNHINLWLLRDECVARRAGLERGRLLHPPRRGQSPVGTDLCHRARRPADPARHRDPHAPRPHRPGALAVRALEGAAVDQRHRLPTARIGSKSTWASAAKARRASLPRTDWTTPSRSSRSARAPATTLAWCRTCRPASTA